MPYNNKSRNYKSRREKFQDVQKNTRLIIIFALIAGAILLFKNRISIWDWIQTFFY